MCFFEANTGGGQIGRVDQADRTLHPGILLDQGLEQMLVNPAQSCHPHPRSKLVPHPHAGHFVLTTQPCKFAPGALLRKHFHQQIYRMHRGEQAQQMQAEELGGAVGPASAAGGAVGPVLIDEIVRDVGIQQGEEFRRAGRGKFGVHEKILPC